MPGRCRLDCRALTPESVERCIAWFVEGVSEDIQALVWDKTQIFNAEDFGTEFNGRRMMITAVYYSYAVPPAS